VKRDLLLTLATGLFVSLGCTRASSNKAIVTLEVPSLKPSSSSQLSSQKVITDGGGDWGGSYPTSISQVNCWAVFVGGPGASQSKCTFGSGSNFRVFKFNEMKGLVSAGSPVQMEVDAGQRTFYAIGFKSTNGQCPKLDPNSDIDSQNLSNPLVLGETTQNLKPGDASVNITVILASDITTQRLGDCSFMEDRPLAGIEFLGAVNGNGSDNVYLNLNSQVCGKFMMKLRSEQGGSALSETSRSFNISYGATDTSGGTWISNQPPQIYGDASCSTVVSSLQIPRGHNAAEFYVRGDGDSWPAGSSGYRDVIFSDSAGQIPPVTARLNIMQLVSPATNQWIRFFEKSIGVIPGECRSLDSYVTVNEEGQDWVVSLNSTNTISVTDFAQTVTTSIPNSNSGLFSSPTCSMGSASTSLSAASAFHTFYFRSMSDWNAKDFWIQSTSTPAFTEFLNVNIQPVASKMTLQKTDSLPVFASSCVPYSVSFQNGSGTNVEIFGYTQNPGTQLAKRVYLKPGIQFPGAQFVNSTCSTAFPFPALAQVGPTMPTGIATELQQSFIPAKDGHVEVRVEGYPFVRGGDDKGNRLSLNVQWDPALLGAAGLKGWGRVEDITTTPSWGIYGRLAQLPFSSTPFSFATMPVSIVSGAGLTASLESGFGFNVFRHSSTGYQRNEVILPTPMNDFVFVALVKLSTMTAATSVFQVLDAGSIRIASLDVAPTMLIVNGTSTQNMSYGAGYYSVLYLKRSGSSLMGRINSNSYSSPIAVAPTPVNRFNLGGSASVQSFAGDLVEYMIIDPTSSSASMVEEKVYQYFRAKIPSVNLP
jgi:hypothetical protein